MSKLAAVASAAAIATALALSGGAAQAAIQTSATVPATPSWETQWGPTVFGPIGNQETLEATGDWDLVGGPTAVTGGFLYQFTLTIDNKANAGARITGWGFDTDPNSTNFAITTPATGWNAITDTTPSGVMDVEHCGSTGNCEGGGGGGIAAGSALSFAFQFVNPNNSVFMDHFKIRYQSVGLDNELSTTLTAVPLPAAGWLLIMGLAGLGFAARRRKAAAA